MEPARAALEAALAGVTITSPATPVYSNVTGAPFPGDAASIRALLGRQLVEPVQWEATLTALTSPGGSPGYSVHVFFTHCKCLGDFLCCTVPLRVEAAAAGEPPSPCAVSSYTKCMHTCQVTHCVALATHPLTRTHTHSTHSPGAVSPGAAPKLFELGPGSQIKSMVRRVSGDAWKAMTNVSPA